MSLATTIIMIIPNMTNVTILLIIKITRLRSKVFSLGRLWVRLMFPLQRLKKALKSENLV